jgi:nitrate reductase NapAB chaperone NapD
VHYSGVLVYANIDQFDDCLRQVDDCAGVEVHFSYPDSGRMIAVLETEDVEDQEESLRRIQSLPSVAAAELVYHYFGDEDGKPFTPIEPTETNSDPSNQQNRCQGACR